MLSGNATGPLWLDVDTDAELEPVPPVPVHVSVKVELALMAAVTSFPEVAFAPDQAPDAEQEAALVDDHVSVEVPPGDTDVGEALSVTAGAGVGGAGTAPSSPDPPPPQLEISSAPANVVAMIRHGAFTAVVSLRR
jgi:hypothetical protein